MKISLSWECPDFLAKNQMTELWIESFSLSVRGLLVTVMKEIKTAVTEKHHSIIRDENVLVTGFWKFRTIKVLMQGLMSVVFQSNPSLHE